MSLNSLQNDMSRRAASMANMAKQANDPQQIQAIQQSLVTGVQNGSIESYIGIPLIQELTQKLTAAKAQMAQTIAGAGMQQPQAQQGAPIAQQVMQQAAQESQGLEALPSNLPQEYAGGGIIAFEDGGEVERYQNEGLVPSELKYKDWNSLPLAKDGGGPSNEGGPFFSGDVGTKVGTALKNVGTKVGTALEQGKRRIDPITGEPITFGQFLRNQEKERNGAEPYVLTETDARLQALHGNKSYYGDGYGTTYDKGNVPQAKINNYMQANKGANQLLDTPPASPAAPRIPGAGSFKAPPLGTYTPTAATLPDRPAPVLTDLNAITKNLPKDQKTVFSKAVTEEQAKLEAMDKPGNEAREAKYTKREAEQEKNSAMNRALNLMNLGFGIAGSKERSVAGALGKEGREGIQNLIQGEAANRAARERLDDARDNFEQQKVQAKKGNYQASQTAGREASRDLLAATQFALTGAQAGNAQAISLHGILQQGDIGKATVGNQREQLNMSAVDQKNRNALGIAGLDLQNRQLNQQAASVNAQLQLGRERLDILKGQIAAGDKRAAAALVIAENKAASTWQTSQDYQQAKTQASKMPPIEAQRFMQNSWLQYKENMLPSLMGGQGGGANIPTFNDMY